MDFATPLEVQFVPTRSNPSGSQLRQVRHAEEEIRAASDIRGFLFDTDAQKRRAKELAVVIEKLKANLQRIDAVYGQLSGQTLKLPEVSSGMGARLRKR